MDAASNPADGAPARDASRQVRDGIVDAYAQLTKVRLNALVLATAAVGFACAVPARGDWARFGWTMLGTALCAASASMLNQLVERRRDALMERTRTRPLPRGRVGSLQVFVSGTVSAFGGFAVLAVHANPLAAALGLANILLYVLVYTPLKPRTTLNTVVGAVCGAVPPMLGWAAASGSLGPGAWALGAVLFVWQLPHFMSLAWLYREDYARGGFAMLPVVDARGDATGQTVLLTSLLLVPVSLLVTLTGTAGWWYAGTAVFLGVAASILGAAFWRRRDRPGARRVFLASIIYLPLLLTVMVIDRGPVDPRVAVRAGATVAEEPDRAAGRDSGVTGGGATGGTAAAPRSGAR
jgi:protoheme IX farnesyltransferase